MAAPSAGTSYTTTSTVKRQQLFVWQTEWRFYRKAECRVTPFWYSTLMASEIRDTACLTSRELPSTARGAGPDALDHCGDLGCRLRCAFSQLANLVGNHRKGALLFAGSCCFNGRIEGQQVGLAGDVGDGAEDRIGRDRRGRRVPGCVRQ